MTHIDFNDNVPEHIRSMFIESEKLIPLSPSWLDKFGTVKVSTAEGFNATERGTTGMTNIQTREVTIWPEEAVDANYKVGVLSYAGGMGLLAHTVMHEWMHVVDMRPMIFEEMIMGFVRPTYSPDLGFLSGYAVNGGDREAWAEAGTEYFGTHGQTDNRVAQWYASEAGWKVGSSHQPVSWDWDESEEWTYSKAMMVLEQGPPEFVKLYL